MSLPTLPVPYSPGFQTNLQATLEQWRQAIEAKAADDHTHGASSAVLSIVAAYANLGTGTEYGESKVTADNGHVYRWLSPGAWVDMTIAAATPDIITGLPLTGGIMGGRFYRYHLHSTLVIDKTSCLDSTGSIKLSVDTDYNDVTVGTTVNAVYDIYIVRLVATGLCAYKTYVKGGSGPSGDATVNAWRWLGFCQNNSSGVPRETMFSDDTIWFSMASECALTSKASPPANCSTMVDISANFPTLSDSNRRIHSILLGGQASTADVTVCVGHDGYNVHHSFIADTANVTDTDINCWHSLSGPPPIFMPFPPNGIIYWGDGGVSNTGTADLRLHAVKIIR